MILAYCGKLDVKYQAFRSKPMDYSESDKFRKQFFISNFCRLAVQLVYFRGALNNGNRCWLTSNE
jgi:hypothetical protein